MRRGLRLVSVVVLIAMVGSYVISCSQAAPTPAAPAPTAAKPAAAPTSAPAAPAAQPTAAPAAAAQPTAAAVPAKSNLPPIKLGSNQPLTGALAATGRENQAGLMSAAEYLNSQGGIDGRRVEIVIQDDQYDVAKTLTVVKQMAERDNVMALVATQGTPNTVALLPYLAERKLVAVGPSGGDNRIGQSPWAFTTFPDLGDQVYAIAKFIVEENKAEKPKIGYLGIASGAAENTTRGLNAAAKDFGAEIVGKLDVPGTTQDLTADLTKLKNAGATDVIFMWGVDMTAVGLNNTAALGWKPRRYSTIGGAGDKLISLGGKNAEGFYVSTVLNLPGVGQQPSAQWTALTALLKKNYPDVGTNGLGGLAFANTLILAQALKNAGVGQKDPTSEQIVAAVEGLKNFETGIIPPVSFAKGDHDGSKAMVMIQVQNGQWAGTGKIVKFR